MGEGFTIASMNIRRHFFLLGVGNGLARPGPKLLYIAAKVEAVDALKVLTGMRWHIQWG